MPKWILVCGKCSSEFEHSQVNYTGAYSFFLPDKPIVPPEDTWVCPKCGYTEITNKLICSIEPSCLLSIA